MNHASVCDDVSRADQNSARAALKAVSKSKSATVHVLAREDATMDASDCSSQSYQTLL